MLTSNLSRNSSMLALSPDRNFGCDILPSFDNMFEGDNCTRNDVTAIKAEDVGRATHWWGAWRGQVRFGTAREEFRQHYGVTYQYIKVPSIMQQLAYVHRFVKRVSIFKSPLISLALPYNVGLSSQSTMIFFSNASKFSKKLSNKLIAYSTSCAPPVSLMLCMLN